MRTLSWWRRHHCSIALRVPDGVQKEQWIRGAQARLLERQDLVIVLVDDL
jgi:hypothetical protein